MGKSVPVPFQLYAGHPALELVNTLDSRFTPNAREMIPAYGDLLRLCMQLGLLTAEQSRKLARSVEDRDAQRVLASAVELREALAVVLYGQIDGAKVSPAKVESLERYFHDAARHRTLRPTDRQWIWSWAGAEQQAEIPVWKLAQAASDLMVSSDVQWIKDCGDPACRWLFLDTSKNHTRRWCDMKTCGNRMKARRFQARSHGNGVVN
jgi:predicted RNA-binding Zn ribbon-like protein